MITTVPRPKEFLRKCVLFIKKMLLEGQLEPEEAIFASFLIIVSVSVARFATSYWAVYHIDEDLSSWYAGQLLPPITEHKRTVFRNKY